MSSNNLDTLDERIVGILRIDSRKPFVEVANEIGLSESAVRRRVKNLVKDGIIRRFTVELNTGDKTSAITLISVSSTSDSSAVTSKLMELDGVEVIYEITGQYDISAIIKARTIEHINKCIDEVRKIQGVSDTNTVIILKTLR